MSDIVLNKGQQAACDAAVDWFYNSSEPVFNIIGSAGTGKSVVLNAILNELDLDADEYLPMAYTGQAAIVMRNKGLFTACTLHSGLYDTVVKPVLDKYGHVLMDKKFNTPVFKYAHVPKTFNDSNIKLFIIDEAWMVPKHMRKIVDDTGIKVLAAGDSAQLPPIKDEPAYLVDGPIYRLTELMRQAETSPLIYIANRARIGLPIDYGMYGNDVLVISEDELNNQLLSYSNITLCSKNKTRDDLNKRVREEIYHHTTDYPQYGERVICRKNNWDKEIDGISLVNGLTGSIVKPPSVDTYDYEDHTFKFDFQPDMLGIPFEDIVANYEYFNSNHDQREMLKSSIYTKGELFEYAYASTVHLSQGSEYSAGIYIEEPTGGGIQNALNYTAITRFKQKLIYVKTTPRFWGGY